MEVFFVRRLTKYSELKSVALFSQYDGQRLQTFHRKATGKAF